MVRQVRPKFLDILTLSHRPHIGFASPKIFLDYAPVNRCVVCRFIPFLSMYIIERQRQFTLTWVCRDAMAGKAPKAWALPRFWVSIRSYKLQPVKKIWGRISRVIWHFSFWRLSKSEKLSELKPPLTYVHK